MAYKKNKYDIMIDDYLRETPKSEVDMIVVSAMYGLSNLQHTPEVNNG